MLDYYCQNATTTFHLMGTCRMGPESDPTSVVDDQLRVRGLEGLRGNRRVHHANHAIGQHQCRDHHDRREMRGYSRPASAAG